MTTVSTHKEWLNVFVDGIKVGSTKFWKSEDVTYFKAGKKPYFNNDGFLIAPSRFK